MKNREKVELALIPLAVAGVGIAAPVLPTHLGVGSLLALGCLAWLVQGGVRDLWVLYVMKKNRSATPQRKLACMCLESTAGLTGLLVGLGLVLCDFQGEVHLTPLRWMLFAGGIFALGYLSKDLVVSWRPPGIRRDPDHHSIVFSWW